MQAAGVDGLLLTHLPDVRCLMRVYGVECGAGVWRVGSAVLFHGRSLHGAGQGRGDGNTGRDLEDAGAGCGMRVD